jgi:hypothetical protein
VGCVYSKRINKLNKNYIRSRVRETNVKHFFEKKGWFCVRAAGSKGIVDIICIKPPKDCMYPDHYEVKLIQIKVSEKFKKEIIETKSEETVFGFANVEYMKFPIRKRKAKGGE